ncbi:MAG TPA: DUF885 domain-containing protein [Chthoniobacterales bacterium]|nr:DUF885 domain-containing protein [Chthoniobacterales bacterium]
MRSRRAVFAFALLVACAGTRAAPSPTPTPKAAAKSPPPAPLHPTGPVKPLAKPSPTPSAKPSAKPSVTPASSKPKSTPAASSSPASSSSPKPSASPKPSPSPPPLKPDAELDAVAEEYIRGYLAARPLHATALGFHEYDGRINEHTRLAIDAELARLRRFEERFGKFDLAKLGPRAAVDLRLLQASIKKELFLIHDLAIYDHNPMTYARALDVGVYAKRKYAPIEDRIRSIVVVENQAPNIMIAAKTNLADVLPRPYVQLAIQIARGASEFLKKDLVDSLADLKDEALRGTFFQSNRRAATTLADYAAWLEKEKLPKAIAEFAIGEEKYRRFLAETELVDMAPADLLEMGLAELKKEQETFAEAAKKIDETRPADVVFKQIQSDHPAAANLIPEVTKRLDAVKKFVVDRKLVTLAADAKTQVKETPQDRRATSFASMDTPGSFEKRANESYFYVTPPENDWTELQKEQWLTSFNYYMGDLLSIHEVYPGHYVQFLRLNASKATKAEKIFESESFVEGWAHYCEQMMIDEGFGGPGGPDASEDEQQRAAKYRMVQAQAAMVRLCRLCVSIKLHTQGMSVEEATKFFQENCYYEEKPAAAEAMRATFDLGCLNYTLGKLQILKLRKDYQEQEGANFSLKKFHDELLSHGMPPIRLLRELMLKDRAKWGEVL